MLFERVVAIVLPSLYLFAIFAIIITIKLLWVFYKSHSAF